MTPAETAVARLVAVFGEPKTPDPQGFVIEFTKALTGYDGRVLERAVDRVIRDSTFWPKPAEILVHARDVASTFYAATARPAEHQPIEEREEPTPEQRERVKRLLDGAMQTLAAAAVPEPKRRDPNWRAAQRDAFEEMQATSPNAALHRQPLGLSQVSRRMSGDRHDEDDR